MPETTSPPNEYRSVVCWLIERSQIEGESTPLYLRGAANDTAPVWTKDVNQAQKYSVPLHAEEVISQWLHGQTAHVVEHAWYPRVETSRFGGDVVRVVPDNNDGTLFLNFTDIDGNLVPVKLAGPGQLALVHHTLGEWIIKFAGIW